MKNKSLSIWFPLHNLFKSFVLLFLLLLPCLGVDQPQKEELNVILITSQKFAGDTNKLRGVTREIIVQASNKNWKIIEIQEDKFDQNLFQIVSSPEKQIILSSGLYGIEALKKFLIIYLKSSLFTYHINY